MIRSPLVVLCGVVLIAVAAAPRGAAAFHDSAVHVEGRLWFPRLSAEVQSSRDAVVGDVITDSDLALDDPVVPGGAATLRFGRHTLRVEGFVLSVDGDTKEDDDRLEFDLAGPYLGLTLSF